MNAKAKTANAPEAVSTVATGPVALPVVPQIPLVAPAGFVPKVLRVVTMPLWKLRAGMEIFVKITGKMEVSKPIKGEKDKTKEPPTLVPSVKLDTGEVGQFIAGSVLKDILNDTYPNDGYVGKGFWIRVEAQKESKEGGGRRYNNYRVDEIEVPK